MCLIPSCNFPFLSYVLRHFSAIFFTFSFQRSLCKTVTLVKHNSARILTPVFCPSFHISPCLLMPSLSYDSFFVSPAAWTFVPYVPLPKGNSALKKIIIKTHICANLTIFKSKLIFFLQLDYFFKLLYSSKVFILCWSPTLALFPIYHKLFHFFFQILLDIYHGSSFFLISIILIKVFIMPFPKLRHIRFINEIWFIHHKIYYLKVLKLMFFSIFTKSCNHRYFLILENYITSKRNPVLVSKQPISFPYRLPEKKKKCFTRKLSAINSNIHITIRKLFWSFKSLFNKMSLLKLSKGKSILNHLEPS